MDEQQDIWFEEPLAPPEDTVVQAVKTLTRDTQMSEHEAEQQVRRATKGVVRVNKPRWMVLDPTEHKLLTSGGDVRFYMVRLGFEFTLAREARESGARFVYARCSTYLWAAGGGEPQPTVYEVIPRDLYEGEARKVNVEIGPEVKLGEVGVAAGKISTDFTVGTVEPVCVGFTGKDERAPYWDLRPNSKSLLGVRHLWLIVEAPAACSGVRLAAMAEGDIQTHLLSIPLGPRSREWDHVPSVVIR
ncbi:MAG: hypothetical protein JXB47_09550 [Anaerolineae bacterium]|nr:hypothetical protein [Anaerolineae bacterium]